MAGLKYSCADLATGRGPSLHELAEDWLTGRRVGERPDDPGRTDRAYRADLTRWAQ